MAKPFAWSFSALSDYQSCPLKYYSTRVLKSVVEAPTEALIWGNRVHKALEDSINGIPPEPEFGPYEKVLDQLRKIPGKMHAEVKLAVDRQLQPVEFLAPEAWCRAVTDVLILDNTIACAFDWKTGKVKDDFEQLKINALLIFANFPEVQRVKAAYIWLKFKCLTKNEFTRKGLGWDQYLASTRFMENSFANNFWPARKNGLCKQYCPVTTCKHNGRFSGG